MQKKPSIIPRLCSSEVLWPSAGQSPFIQVQWVVDKSRNIRAIWFRRGLHLPSDPKKTHCSCSVHAYREFNKPANLERATEGKLIVFYHLICAVIVILLSFILITMWVTGPLCKVGLHKSAIESTLQQKMLERDCASIEAKTNNVTFLAGIKALMNMTDFGWQKKQRQLNYCPFC